MNRIVPLLALLFIGCEAPGETRAPTEGSKPATTQVVEAQVACRGPSRLAGIGDTRSGRAVQLAALGHQRLAIVADADDRALVAVDLTTHGEAWRAELGAPPEQLAILGDGRIVVSLPSEGKVAWLAVAADGPRELCRRDGGAEPVGLAATRDDRRILVASRWDRRLHVLSGDDGSRLRTRALARDPFGVVLTADDTRAVVSHAVGGRLSVVALDDMDVVEHPIARADFVPSFSSFVKEAPPSPQFPRRSRFVGATLRVDRVGEQGFAVTRGDDGRIWSPTTLTAPVGQLRVGYGSGQTVMGAIAELGADGLELSTALRGREDNCVLPRAAVAVREHAWVACLGSATVASYRLEAPGYSIDQLDVPEGPRGLAVDAEGKQLVVWSQHAGALTAFDLDAQGAHSAAMPPTFEVKLARRAPLPAEVARGRRAFHGTVDRRVASDGRACASCHPDGRDDGLTWQTSEGPRQTPMLVDRLADSAPFGWDGAIGDAAEHMKRSLSRLSGQGLGEQGRADVLAYLRWLRAPVTEGAPDPLLARGRELFESEALGCASCHPRGGTDGLTHDFSSAPGEPAFDSPSLRFVARSAPYFHDGRYATLDEMLSDPNGAMAASHRLGSSDRHAMVLFLETL